LDEFDPEQLAARKHELEQIAPFPATEADVEGEVRGEAELLCGLEKSRQTLASSANAAAMKLRVGRCGWSHTKRRAFRAESTGCRRSACLDFCGGRRRAVGKQGPPPFRVDSSRRGAAGRSSYRSV